MKTLLALAALVSLAATANAQTPLTQLQLARANINAVKFTGASVAIVETDIGYCYRIEVAVQYLMNFSDGEIRVTESTTGLSLTGAPVSKPLFDEGTITAYLQFPVDSPAGVAFASDAILTLNAVVTKATYPVSVSQFGDTILIDRNGVTPR